MADEWMLPYTIWDKSDYSASAMGTNLLASIIGTKKFDYPKSLYAVIDCLRVLSSNKDSTFLDFFAGSGTTGHAVLELNKKDRGNRKFILCTNNELNGQEKNLREQGLSEKEIQSHGICQAVTYPRIKRVIGGYTDVEGIPANLKYYKTVFVPAGLTDKNKVEITKKAIDMLCIKEATFDEIEINKKYKIFKNKNKYTGIIIDHQSIDDFKKIINKIDGKFSVYIFSLGDDTFDQEFADMKEKVTLSPIPEAILRVYRRIFK
jgi:adenine-specific DNA-methyltransferase